MHGSSFYKCSITCVAILLCNGTALAQQTIAALAADLNKATTWRTKADVCFHLSNRYAIGLKIDSALYYAERVLAFSQKDGYESGLGKHHLALSTALYYRGKFDESIRNAAEAIRILTVQKDNAFLGLSYWQLGTAEYSQGNTALSRRAYWTSVHYLQKAGDAHNLYRTFFWLARSYERTSDYDSAAEYYVRALALAEKAKEPFKIFNAANGLGSTYLALHDLHKAYQYLDYGLKNETPSVNKVNHAEILRLYGLCLSFLHRFEKAQAVINEFETLAKGLNHAWSWAYLDLLRGVQEYEKQSYPVALDYLRNAYRKGTAASLPQLDLKNIVFSLAKTEHRMRLYDSGIVHLRLAAELSRATKSLIDAAEAEFLLSEAFEETRQLDSALFYHKRYAGLKESVFSVEKQKIFAEVTTRYESEKKEHAIRMLQKEGEANSYLLRLRNQQIEKQQWEDEEKSQQLAMVSQQNEIYKLDATQKALSLDNEKQENEKNAANLQLLKKEAAFQKLMAEKQAQQKNITWLSLAAIMLFGTYLLYRYARRKKLQNQQEVLKERLRISRELHDEVGSTLSGIAMYSHLTRQQMMAEKSEEVERSLDNIQLSAGEMIGKLSDIVWLINPEKDSFQKLIERLEEFATEMGAIKGIDVQMQLQKSLQEVDLPVDKRRNIYLICKEAITNAVKYSGASQIEIVMEETDNKKLKLLIRDNGKGFNQVTVRKGNGLHNMQQRAAESEGQFVIHSLPGEGTTVSLVCKIT